MSPIYDIADVESLSDSDLLDRYTRLKAKCEARPRVAYVDYNEVLDIVACEAIRRGLLPAETSTASAEDIDEIPF